MLVFINFQSLIASTRTSFSSLIKISHLFHILVPSPNFSFMSFIVFLKVPNVGLVHGTGRVKPKSVQVQACA